MVPDDGEVVGGEVTVEGFFDAGDEGGHVLDVLFGHHVEGYQILVVVVVEGVNLHDAFLAGGILTSVVFRHNYHFYASQPPQARRSNCWFCLGT